MENYWELRNLADECRKKRKIPGEDVARLIEEFIIPGMFSLENEIDRLKRDDIPHVLRDRSYTKAIIDSKEKLSALIEYLELKWFPEQMTKGHFEKKKEGGKE